MKRQVLERAQSTVEAFLHDNCADTTLSVMSVVPEVDGDGDEFVWVSIMYDDGNGAKVLPEPAARLRLKERLRAELLSADVEAFAVFSFVAKSEVGVEAE